MRYLARLLFLSILLNVGGFSLASVQPFFSGPVFSELLYSKAFAQDAKDKNVKSSQSDELNEAQRRIDRLEAQITEMKSMIGALQTLVQKGVRQNQPLNNQRFDRRLPLDQRLDAQRLDQGAADRVTGEPQFRTDGWGADTQTEKQLSNGQLSNGRVISEQPMLSDRNVPGADLPLDGQVAKSRVAVNGVPSRKLYDAGYNYLMASDYVSAEATFRSFLRNYPQDGLSGNAQYWLGETYFARGDYRKAAHEFLKGYKTYKTSAKAPDNLLKLGMSLHRLGQSDAACQTYTQLREKYKSLSGHISRRLGQEQTKARCR
jgi:tol-pal system protein YbgF